MSFVSASKAAMKIVPEPMGPGFYSHLFLVPQNRRGGGWSGLVLEFNPLSQFFNLVDPQYYSGKYRRLLRGRWGFNSLWGAIEHYEMESPRSILLLMMKGQWAASFNNSLLIFSGIRHTSAASLVNLSPPRSQSFIHYFVFVCICFRLDM